LRSFGFKENVYITSKRMPREFTVSDKDLKAFPAWLHKVRLSEAKKWIDLRNTLREQSTPVPGKRRKVSPTFLGLMKKTFQSMKGCFSDISCLGDLFMASIDNATPKIQEQLMRDMNVIVPIQFPTESQLGSYDKWVSQLRGKLRTRFGDEWVNERTTWFQVAGGSNQRKAFTAFKQASKDRSAAALALRLSKKIPVTQGNILKVGMICSKSDRTVDHFIIAQMASGARKTEVLNPRVTNWEAEDSERDGYLVRWGTAKEKKVRIGQDEGDGDVEMDIEPEDEEEQKEQQNAPAGFFGRRRVEAPILRFSKTGKLESLDDLYTVDDLKASVRKVRADWGIQDLIDQGFTDKEIASRFDKIIAERIRELFPAPYEFSLIHRTNAISSHFLRKVYANYSYLTLANTTEVTKSSWMAKYLGWSLSSGLQTSISYSDLEIIMIPPKLPELKEAEKAIQDFVTLCTQAEEKKEEMAEADVNSGIHNWRAVVRDGQKNKRKSVELTDGPDKRQRLFYNQRGGTTKVKRVESAKKIVTQLRALGIDPVSQEMVREFGFGPVYSKGALLP
jgi:hypothetical protein